MILRHLEASLAENETVHTYLEMQRHAVLDALTKADGHDPMPSAAPPPEPPRPKKSVRRTTKPFKLERRRSADGPLPVAVHTADCHMSGELAHAVNRMEARLAITDAGLRACEFCRPDLELGIEND